MENTCIDPTLRRTLAGSAKRLYFIGICGISMSGLAVMAKMRGWEVAGCDRAPSCAAAHALFRLGISVEAEETPHPEDADLFVFTTAVREDSPAVCYARERGLPLFSRADFLATLMEESPTRVAVAGMHGKSTTVGMLSAILTAGGARPDRVVRRGAYPGWERLADR